MNDADKQLCQHRPPALLNLWRLTVHREKAPLMVFCRIILKRLKLNNNAVGTTVIIHEHIHCHLRPAASVRAADDHSIKPCTRRGKGTALGGHTTRDDVWFTKGQRLY